MMEITDKMKAATEGEYKQLKYAPTRRAKVELMKWVKIQPEDRSVRKDRAPREDGRIEGDNKHRVMT